MKGLDFIIPPDGFKRLFYDIETSQAVATTFRIGSKVYLGHDDLLIPSAIICICYKWEGQKDVHSLEWVDGCDKTVVSRFIEIALMADEVVGHNGDSFDEKWVRTQAMLHGIPCPDKLPSFDTLKKVRTHFRFPSNRLDYIGKLFFDEGKSPMSKQDWTDILVPLIPKLYGHPIELPKSYHDAINKMVQYCKKDVELLENVFHKIQPYVSHNHHTGAHTGYGRFSCPKCGSDNVIHRKSRHTKAGTLKHQLQCKVKACGGYFTVSNKVWEEKLKDDWRKNQSYK